MPEETYNTIMGNTGTPAGKEVSGVDPALVQQDAQEVQQEAGKAVTGVAPEIRQQKVESVTPAAGLPVQNQVQVPAQQPAAPPEPKHLSYVEMLQMAYPYKAPTPEEVEKERKREKNARLWSAIGDGIAAMADIYFAGKSGISNYKPGSSMSAKVNARADQLRKEREANAKQYFSMYMQAKAHDDSNDHAQQRLDLQRESAEQQRRQWEAAFAHSQEREKIQDERYAAEQEFKKQQYEDARADAAKAAELKDAQIKTDTSKQSANYALANQRNNKGSGSSAKTPTLQIGDEIMTYNNITDYNRAVEGYAEYFGIDLYEEVETKDRKGKVKGTTQRRKSIAKLAAEVQAASGAKPKGVPDKRNDNDEWAGVDAGGNAGSEWDGVQE